MKDFAMLRTARHHDVLTRAMVGMQHRPGMSRPVGRYLTARRHVDLLRVSSALCR